MIAFILLKLVYVDYCNVIQLIVYFFLFAGAIVSLSCGATVGITFVTTAVVFFTAGALGMVLVYHRISKYRSQTYKTKSSSHQQQQAVSPSNPLQQTGPEYEEVMELSENMAYKPVQSIELRANEAYQHVQQWFIGTA